MRRLTGAGVSHGVALGPAVMLMQNPLVIRFAIPEDRVEHEVVRLRDARERSKRQLREIGARLDLRARAELRYLFDAQILMLDDPLFVNRAEDLIRTERANAEWVVWRACSGLAAVFDEVEDPYVRERKGEVADLSGRLRMNLRRARDGALFDEVEDGAVLVADQLSPSIAAQIDWTRIQGFATDAGSRTDHTAILARSLHVPAVMGLMDISARVAPGSMLVIDGTMSEVLIEPSADQVAEYRDRRERWVAVKKGRERQGSGPAKTADHLEIRIDANIERVADVEAARQQGAQGIGLFRSEFLLAGGDGSAVAASEDAQYELYRQLVDQARPDYVTVRLFTEAALDEVAGELSARELRGIQLRALLRAAIHGPLRILVPTVSGVGDLRQTRTLLAESQAQLEGRGETCGPLSVGAMIEIPSAALTADMLAREADFFSIGTNDLVQYTLGASRSEPRAAALYEPLHPAVLRLIRQVLEAASRVNVPVALCGEMAADPVALPVLIGLGLGTVSMNPAAIPTTKQIIAQLRAETLRAVTARVLSLATAAEIEEYLAHCLGRDPRDELPLGSAAEGAQT
ncbi:MAG: phosphoenolpyruvate--protein phosphotransferase [Acidobacteria bacterium]|nr:phosphoenolpyruvate--protein phosphotransferase [Acidobacteriota bacterium]